MRQRLLRTGVLIVAMAVGICARAQTDDSNARPPVTKADLQIVKRAEKILDSSKKWNRADTRNCPDNAKTFSLYCALEKATKEAGNQFEHRGAAMQEARFVIEEVAPGKDYDHRLMGYNNDPGTTFADIQKVFKLLEAHVAKRLAQEPSGDAVSTLPLPKSSNEQDVRVIKRVRELLSVPAAWNHNAPTQRCVAEAVTFSLYCAFDKAQHEITNGAEGAAIREVRQWISSSAPNRAQYQARLVDYNNDRVTRFEDIQKLLQLVEDRLTKRATTY